MEKWLLRVGRASLLSHHTILEAGASWYPGSVSIQELVDGRSLTLCLFSTLGPQSYEGEAVGRPCGRCFDGSKGIGFIRVLTIQYTSNLISGTCLFSLSGKAKILGSEVTVLRKK